MKASYSWGTVVILIFWIIGGDILSSFLNPTGNPSFALKFLPALTGWIGLILVIVFYHKKNITYLATDRSRLNCKKIIVGFFIFLIVIGLLHLLFIQDIKLNPDFNSSFFLESFLSFWTMMLLQVSLEEFFFRGYLFHAILSKFPSKFLASLLPSIFFGILHLGSSGTDKFGSEIIVSYIWMGFVFGMVRSLDRGLEISLGGHLANNFFLCLLVQPTWQKLNLSPLYMNDTPINSTELIVFQFILGAIFFISLHTIYRWSFSGFLFKKHSRPSGS